MVTFSGNRSADCFPTRFFSTAHVRPTLWVLGLLNSCHCPGCWNPAVTEVMQVKLSTLGKDKLFFLWLLVPLGFSCWFPSHAIFSFSECTHFENREQLMQSWFFSQGYDPCMQFPLSCIFQRMYLGWGDSDGKTATEDKKVVSSKHELHQWLWKLCFLYLHDSLWQIRHHVRAVPIWRLNYHPIQLTQSSSWLGQAAMNK